MITDILVGILYGAVIGYVTNLLVFRKMEDNREKGVEPLRGLGGVFFLRYALDAISLVLLYLIMSSATALVAAALSITVAVKVSLFMVYTRKGGRFD